MSNTRFTTILSLGTVMVAFGAVAVSAANANDLSHRESMACAPAEKITTAVQAVDELSEFSASLPQSQRR